MVVDVLHRKKIIKTNERYERHHYWRYIICNAAPFDTFWNMLDTVDIKDKLKSIDSELDIDESEIIDAEEEYVII